MIIIINYGVILDIAFAYLLIDFVSVCLAFFEKTARKEILSIFWTVLPIFTQSLRQFTRLWTEMVELAECL